MAKIRAGSCWPHWEKIDAGSTGAPEPLSTETVKIDVSVYRRKVFSMSDRARLDKIVIRRCGKDKWVSAHPEYLRIAEMAARRRPAYE